MRSELVRPITYIEYTKVSENVLGKIEKFVIAQFTCFVHDTDFSALFIILLRRAIGNYCSTY